MYCLHAENGRLRIMSGLNVVYYRRSDKLIDEVDGGGVGWEIPPAFSTQTVPV